jgi:putative serine protease PepD
MVTNNRVVGGHTRFRVTLSGGDDHEATLVGTFAAGDLAVIRLTDGAPPAASFGDSPRCSRASSSSPAAIRSACARA